MKQLLLLTFLALFCLARSAPASSSSNGRLVLPNYDEEDENVNTDDDLNSDEDEHKIVTTTSIPTTRSTFVFPTRSRPTVPARRPWLTQRTTETTTIFDYESITEDIDTNSVENGFKYIKNIGEFFKKLLADIKKFFQKLANNDIIRLIRQFFVGKDND